MRTLDLYKERKYSLVKLSDGKEYKFPNEYTVDEVERLLELRVEQEALEQEIVDDKKKQLDRFFSIAFNQIEILFQRYQPEITAEYLKKHVTENEVLEMLGFFQKYRHIALIELRKESDQSKEADEVKKKSKSARAELRELRRTVTFMVANGFSLADLRRLYIDEIYEYHDQLIYVMEKEGKYEKGTYAKMIKRSKSNGTVDETAKQLRQQIMKVIVKKE